MEAKLKKVGSSKAFGNKMCNVYQQKPSPQILQKTAATPQVLSPDLKAKLPQLKKFGAISKHMANRPIMPSRPVRRKKKKKKKGGVLKKIGKGIKKVAKGIKKGIKKVGKFVKKHASKIMTVVGAAAVIFPPAAAGAAAAKAGAAKAGATAKAGAGTAKAGAKAGADAAKAGKAAAKDGGKMSKFLKKVGDKFKNFKDKIEKVTNGIKKGFSESKLGKLYDKLPNQVKSVIKQEVQGTITARRQKYAKNMMSL